MEIGPDDFTMEQGDEQSGPHLTVFEKIMVSGFKELNKVPANTS